MQKIGGEMFKYGLLDIQKNLLILIFYCFLKGNISIPKFCQSW